MLLQSYNEEIDILPSLPDCYRKGYINGICARGGYILNIYWQDGKLEHAELTSRIAKKCTVLKPRRHSSEAGTVHEDVTDTCICGSYRVFIVSASTSENCTVRYPWVKNQTG